MKERREREGSNKLFSIEDFTFAGDFSYCICPAGKRLYRSGGNVNVRGFLAVKFKGPKSACQPCSLRTECLRHPEWTDIRQVAYFKGRTKEGESSLIDSPCEANAR